MAAVTVQSTAVLNGVRPDGITPPGVVVSRRGKYTNSGAKDANSVIELIPVPKGAEIIDIIIQVTALGAGRTLDVGDGGQVDRFFDGISAVNAALTRFGSQMGGATANTAGNVVMGAAALGYKYTANDTIDVKVLGDTLPDGAVITGIVLYRMPATADEAA